MTSIRQVLPEQKIIEIVESAFRKCSCFWFVHAYEMELSCFMRQQAFDHEIGENSIGEEPFYQGNFKYREYVTLRLYEKLCHKIPGLMTMITVDNHITREGHTPLFMLKSLDLDIRLGLELGTLYGHDRVDLFPSMVGSGTVNQE